MSDDDTRLSRRQAWALGILVFFAVVVLHPAARPAGSAAAIEATAASLRARHTVDIAQPGDEAKWADTPEATFVRGAHRYSQSGPLMALVRLPADALFGLEWGAAVTNGLLSAWLAIAIFFALVRRRVRGRAALTWAILLVVSTELWAATRTTDGMLLSAALMLTAFEAGSLAVVSGLVCALPLVEIDLALLGALVLARAGLGKPLGARVLTAVPLVGAASLALAIRAKLGAPPLGGGDLTTGLLGLVVSTGEGLIWFTPLVLCAVPALKARRAWWTVALALSALFVTACRSDWYGDLSFGPIRLVPVLPLVLVEIVGWAWSSGATVRTRRWARTLAGAGALVQALGAAIDPTVYIHIADQVKGSTGAAGWFFPRRDQVHFMPQFSPIVGHAWLVAHLARPSRNLLSQTPLELIVPTKPQLDTKQSAYGWNWWAVGKK